MVLVSVHPYYKVLKGIYYSCFLLQWWETSTTKNNQSSSGFISAQSDQGLNPWPLGAQWVTQQGSQRLQPLSGQIQPNAAALSVDNSATHAFLFTVITLRNESEETENTERVKIARLSLRDESTFVGCDDFKLTRVYNNNNNMECWSSCVGPCVGESRIRLVHNGETCCPESLWAGRGESSKQQPRIATRGPSLAEFGFGFYWLIHKYSGRA